MFARLILALVLTLTAAVAAPAQGFSGAGPMVDARLIADQTGAAPGETIHLALHQDITEGWHTYWRNPGDSGEPTRVELALPDGWSRGEIVWPAPQPYPLGPLTNYGYSDAVTLPMRVTIPEDAPAGPITIPAEATWLVCEDICIPESGSFEITINVGAPAIDPGGARLISAAFEAAPVEAGAIEAGLAYEGEALALTLAGEPLSGRVRDLYFFPYEADVIDHAGEQIPGYAEAAARLTLEPGFGLDGAVEAAHRGVVTFERDTGSGWERAAYVVEAQPGVEVAEIAPGAASAPSAGGLAAGVTFLQAAGLALLGGLLLNLMPCVFPVLSMKALQLVNKRGAKAGEARVLGVFFLAGVMATFLALAGGLLGLRGLLGLADISWGYQLQEPWIVGALAVLMFLIGLNFLGMFEIGTSLQGVGGSVAADGRSGSFFTGVLAVFVAAPCVAPFMTTALAYAFAQPPAAALAVFAFLGLGLALPFVLVSFFPPLLKALPKPGPWMERFKQFLAFPMFATAVWLIWVLGVQTGPDGVLWGLIALLAVSFAIWALQASSRVWKAIGGAAVIGAGAALWSASAIEQAEPAAQTGEYAAWSPAVVEALRAEGRPVFIDFTAAWCVTCQYNKRTALAASGVNAAFAEADVALLRADFTNRDSEIAEVLQRHGAAGVPLYLMYPEGGGEPEVLPPLLTPRIVIQAVDRAVNKPST